MFSDVAIISFKLMNGCKIRRETRITLSISFLRLRHRFKIIIHQVCHYPVCLSRNLRSNLPQRKMARRDIFSDWVCARDDPNPSHRMAPSTRSFSCREHETQHHQAFATLKQSSSSSTSRHTRTHIDRAWHTCGHAHEWKNHILGKSVKCYKCRFKPSKATKYPGWHTWVDVGRGRHQNHRGRAARICSHYEHWKTSSSDC